MIRTHATRLVLLLTLALGLVGAIDCIATAGHPKPYEPMDPKNLTPQQNQLLNYAYLTLRPDLLDALKPTGAQRVVVRQARMSINYIVTLRRNDQGEARIEGGRGGGGGMVKFVLQDLQQVHDALTDEQRQAWATLFTDHKLQQVTVDSWDSYFLLRYTFAPGDHIEKVKTSDDRVLDVVVPEKDDMDFWWTELNTGDDLIKVMENDYANVRPTAGEWLIRKGSASLDQPTRERLAELILSRVEKDQAQGGFWMQAYSQVAQARDEQRVFALLDKCSIHNVAGMVAAYAAIAPAKALDYISKPREDKNYPIRAIQGLGMAPDGLRLLKLAQARMPNMKWAIDQQIKSVTELQKARAEGKPENPGEAAAIEARKKAQIEAQERPNSNKTPGDYQAFDDWFKDLSSTDRRTADKAAHHFATSVHAVDLATLTPQQRAAVFKIAHAALAAPKTILDRDNAGRILIASAAAEDTQSLLALFTPGNWRSHYPLAALMRVNPDRAVEFLLSKEGDTKFRTTPIQNAAALVPSEAIVVLEKAIPGLKSENTRETYRRIIAESKQKLEAPK